MDPPRTGVRCQACPVGGPVVAGLSPELPAPAVQSPESFRGRLLLRRPGPAGVSPTGVMSAPDKIVALRDETQMSSVTEALWRLFRVWVRILGRPPEAEVQRHVSSGTACNSIHIQIRQTAGPAAHPDFRLNPQEMPGDPHARDSGRRAGFQIRW